MLGHELGRSRSPIRSMTDTTECPWAASGAASTIGCSPRTTEYRGSRKLQDPQGCLARHCQGQGSLADHHHGTRRVPGAARALDQVGCEDARNCRVLGLGSVESGCSGMTEHCARMRSDALGKSQQRAGLDPETAGNARLGRLGSDQDLGELSLSGRLSSTRTTSPCVWQKLGLGLDHASFHPFGWDWIRF